jgi:hypothetical protein
LSRLRGNSHERFLGEGAVATRALLPDLEGLGPGDGSSSTRLGVTTGKVKRLVGEVPSSELVAEKRQNRRRIQSV